jgi:hypothetical protein
VDSIVMAQEVLSSRYAFQVRVPGSLAAATKAAADRELMTLSEYVRRVLIERLRADGIDPAAAVVNGAAGLRKYPAEMLEP